VRVIAGLRHLHGRQDTPHLIAITASAKKVCRWASLSCRLATARLRLSRLMPHSTAWRLYGSRVEGGPTAGVALASRGGRHGRRPFAFNQGIVSRLQYGVMPLLERVRTDQVIVGLVYHEPGELAASVECW